MIALSDGIAALKKVPGNHHNDKDNVSTKVVVMRKRVKVLHLMISKVFLCGKIGHQKYQCKNYANIK